MDDFDPNSHNQLTDGADQGVETDHVDVAELFRLLDEAQRKIDAIRQLLAGAPAQFNVGRFRARAAPTVAPVDQEGARIIEGAFDGQNMVGPDGKQYSVPANYASKSKLVEGDVLKLTITRDGSFIYKQIGPVDRQRLVGTLGRDETTGEFKVDVEDR
ncbi:MAG: hypothetical protein HY092_02930, partial [Candidatus Kerfeldbacteria bacterium]|nr:hypothetical protein [Candidatus Kerfeldbacteria bacterium]